MFMWRGEEVEVVERRQISTSIRRLSDGYETSVPHCQVKEKKNKSAIITKAYEPFFAEVASSGCELDICISEGLLVDFIVEYERLAGVEMPEHVPYRSVKDQGSSYQVYFTAQAAALLPSGHSTHVNAREYRPSNWAMGVSSKPLFEELVRRGFRLGQNRRP